jgi:hypothetical protein
LISARRRVAVVGIPARIPDARLNMPVRRVRHLRLRPTRHAFDYPVWFLLLRLRALRSRPEPSLRRNRGGWTRP